MAFVKGNSRATAQPDATRDFQHLIVRLILPRVTVIAKHLALHCECFFPPAPSTLRGRALSVAVASLLSRGTDCTNWVCPP